MDELAILQIEFAITIALSAFYTWLMSEPLKVLWYEKKRRWRLKKELRHARKSKGKGITGFDLTRASDRFRL